MEREYEKALLDADAANPALATARELLEKAREAQAAGRVDYEYVYEPRGPEELQKFKEWSDCHAAQIANERLKELADLGPGGRSLMIWFAKGVLSTMVPQKARLPENIQTALPQNPEDLSDDDALRALLRYYQALAAADCAKLEPSLSPSAEMRAELRRWGRADFDLFICNEFVSGMTPESVRAALKRAKEASNQVTEVWPNWAECELILARQKHLASGPPPRETLLKQDSRVWLLILGNVLVVLILGALWFMRRLKSQS